MFDAIKEAFSYVGDQIVTALSNFFGKICYYLVSAMCHLLRIAYEFFSVFSGQRKIQYDGSEQYLINVFFGNKSINNIYWGMALIGFAFIIAFTIISVVKKSFDMEGKVQKSHGAILAASAKSALTVLLLSAVMSAVLNLSNVLVTQVGKIFDNAATLDQQEEMYFTDDQYATMARVLNTVGNYSLSASYKSRYNLNSCYNSIRQDLLTLQSQGVFTFYYEDDYAHSWQAMISKLVRERDPRYEIPLDDKNTVRGLTDIMDELKQNKAFYPISYIKRKNVVTTDTVSLDRVVFLSGTLDSARNMMYNENPSVSDACRAPFMNGDKDIYSFDDVTESFDTGITGISYLLIAVMGWFTFKNVVLCVFNCIARIFNLIGLYIIAPPIIATSPLDEGGKFKQWISSAIVQVFGIFGTIIPMRLVILFVPMILSDKLVLFPDSSFLNFLGKALFIVGGIEASNRFSGIITGILTDTGASSSASAGDMKELSKGAIGKGLGVAKGALGVAATISGAKTLGNSIGKKATDFYQSMADFGGIAGAFRHGGQTKDDIEKKKEKQQQEKNKQLPPQMKR